MSKTKTKLLDLKFERISVPSQWKFEHKKNGGKNLKRWLCPLNDREVIRVVSSQDPTENSLEWHISMSIGAANGTPGELRQMTTLEHNSTVAYFVRLLGVMFLNHEQFKNKKGWHAWEFDTRRT